MYRKLQTLRSKLPEPVKARLRGPKKVFRRLVVLPFRRTRYQHIPIAMITGTKGKTTTTRMLSNILTEARFRVGCTTTDGIVIGDELLHEIDSSGYNGHARVLNDRSVTAAVLETGRGSILRDGLYIDRCDAAALLNLGREQIGIDGIDTVEQMAKVKRQVIDAARKSVVLNADDPICSELIREFPVDRTSVFSLNPNCSSLRDHLNKGGRAFYLKDGDNPKIVQTQRSQTHTIISIADLPSAWDGIVRHNIANAMAAAALAEGLSVSREFVRRGLQNFKSTIRQSFGRFSVLPGYPFLVILDVAISPPAAEALGDSISKLNIKGDRRCLLSTVGDRPNWHYQELANALAHRFDHFICYEVEEFRRGRARGEIVEQLRSALLRSSVNERLIDTATNYEEALNTLANKIEPGDLAVILGMHKRKDIPMINRALARHISSATRQDQQLQMG